MNNRQTHSKGDIVFHIFNTLLMILILICTLYPFWYVIVSSLSSISHVTNSVVLLWPDGLHWDSYQQVFRNNLVPVAYGNTLFVTLIGTAVSMLLTSLSAFVLSRKELPGNKVMTLFVVFTMLFNAGLVPFYLQVKNLHLLNSRWSLIWPFALSTYNTVILRNFFKSVPNALYEAASIDGATRMQQIISITIPGILPTVVTMFIMNIGKMVKVGYESILLLYEPSTYATADVISTYSFRMGIQNGDYGVATAAGLFEAVIALILVVAANKVSKRLTENALW